MKPLRTSLEGRGSNLSRLYGWAIVVVSALSFLLSTLSALSLPYFDGPDESRHYNSVARLVDGGGWPLPYEAKLLGSSWQAGLENGGVLPDGQGLESLPAAADRSTFLGATEFPDRGRDYMVQHPPGYYAITAAAVSLAGGGDLRWDHAFIIIRVFSSFILACSIPFIIGGVRWATGSRLAGVVAGVAPLAIPFFTTMGGYASNDVLLVTACTATAYFLLRAWRSPTPSEWLLPLAGLSYGVALLSKGLAMVMAPVVCVLAILAVRRLARAWPGAVIRLFAAALLAFVVGGWWWLRNLILLGTLQPSQLGSRTRQEEAFDGYSLLTFLKGFVSRLNATFWGRGGREDIAYPEPLVIAAGVLLVLSVIAAIVFSRSRVAVVVLLCFPVLILVTLFINAHDIYWDTGRPNRGIQGRYLFSGIIAFALVAGAVWQAAASRSRRGLRVLFAIIPVVLAPLIAVAGTIWSAYKTWQWRSAEIGMNPSDAFALMAVPTYWPAILAGSVAALMIALVVLVVRIGLDDRPPDGPMVSAHAPRGSQAMVRDL